MGKFDGVLLVSDFDNTLVYTEDVFKEGADMRKPPAYSVERIQYFIDNGGTFAVVTGRTWLLIREFIHDVPHNAPCGVGNGAGLIDTKTGEYLYQNMLPAAAVEHMDEVLAAFPDLSCEIYCADDSADAINPCTFSYNHARSAKYEYRVVTDLHESTLPIIKVLFEEDEPKDLPKIAEFIRSRPWFKDYELASSSNMLLELTARGANKGTLVKALVDRLGMSMEHLYCVGDQGNDLSMIRAAGLGVAMGNATESVKAAADAVTADCDHDGVAEVIETYLLHTL